LRNGNKSSSKQRFGLLLKDLAKFFLEQAAKLILSNGRHQSKSRNFERPQKPTTYR
jgi:hypothetical protein